MLKLEKDLRKAYGDEYDNQTRSSVVIALSIAMFAHRNQYRLDGSLYYTHPHSLAKAFKEMICIDNENFDYDDLLGCGVPFQGVLEVCWLHDVIEDTEYTEKEIEDIYCSKNLGLYYKQYIKSPLLLITHDKEEPYPSYIEKVCQNPISALVKLLDLRDNLDPMSLDKLDNRQLKRGQDYYKYIKVINDKYHFVERIQLYRHVYIK